MQLHSKHTNKCALCASPLQTDTVKAYRGTDPDVDRKDTHRNVALGGDVLRLCDATSELTVSTRL